MISFSAPVEASASLRCWCCCCCGRDLTLFHGGGGTLRLLAPRPPRVPNPELAGLVTPVLGGQTFPDPNPRPPVTGHRASTPGLPRGPEAIDWNDNFWNVRDLRGGMKKSHSSMKKQLKKRKKKEEKERLFTKTKKVYLYFPFQLRILPGIDLEKKNKSKIDIGLEKVFFRSKRKAFSWHFLGGVRRLSTPQEHIHSLKRGP